MAGVRKDHNRMGNIPAWMGQGDPSLPKCQAAVFRWIEVGLARCWKPMTVEFCPDLGYVMKADSLTRSKNRSQVKMEPKASLRWPWTACRQRSHGETVMRCICS
jgi:hypothetical protein